MLKYVKKKKLKKKWKNIALHLNIYASVKGINFQFKHFFNSFVFQFYLSSFKNKKLKVGYQTKKIKNKKIRIIFQILNLKTKFERKIATNISRFL